MSLAAGMFTTTAQHTKRDERLAKQTQRYSRITKCGQDCLVSEQHRPIGYFIGAEQTRHSRRVRPAIGEPPPNTMDTTEPATTPPRRPSCATTPNRPNARSGNREFRSGLGLSDGVPVKKKTRILPPVCGSGDPDDHLYNPNSPTYSHGDLEPSTSELTVSPARHEVLGPGAIERGVNLYMEKANRAFAKNKSHRSSSAKMSTKNKL